MKTKALISCAVTAQLICGLNVFAYAKSRFSHDEAQILVFLHLQTQTNFITIVNTCTLSYLSIAQRMGLIEAPGQLLTETEWETAKEKSNKRDDSKMPCVICKEDFGTQQQVLYGS